jgi:hypothetical protein
MGGNLYTNGRFFSWLYYIDVINGIGKCIESGLSHISKNRYVSLIIGPRLSNIELITRERRGINQTIEKNNTNNNNNP